MVPTTARCGHHGDGHGPLSGSRLDELRPHPTAPHPHRELSSLLRNSPLRFPSHLHASCVTQFHTVVVIREQLGEWGRDVEMGDKAVPSSTGSSQPCRWEGDGRPGRDARSNYNCTVELSRPGSPFCASSDSSLGSLSRRARSCCAHAARTSPLNSSSHWRLTPHELDDFSVLEQASETQPSLSQVLRHWRSA